MQDEAQKEFSSIEEAENASKKWLKEQQEKLKELEKTFNKDLNINLEDYLNINLEYIKNCEQTILSNWQSVLDIDNSYDKLFDKLIGFKNKIEKEEEKQAIYNILDHENNGLRKFFLADDYKELNSKYYDLYWRVVGIRKGIEKNNEEQTEQNKNKIKELVEDFQKFKEENQTKIDDNTYKNQQEAMVEGNNKSKEEKKNNEKDENIQNDNSKKNKTKSKKITKIQLTNSKIKKYSKNRKKKLLYYIGPLPGKEGEKYHQKNTAFDTTMDKPKEIKWFIRDSSLVRDVANYSPCAERGPFMRF